MWHNNTKQFTRNTEWIYSYPLKSVFNGLKVELFSLTIEYLFLLDDGESNFLFINSLGYNVPSHIVN